MNDTKVEIAEMLANDWIIDKSDPVFWSKIIVEFKWTPSNEDWDWCPSYKEIYFLCPYWEKLIRDRWFDDIEDWERDNMYLLFEEWFRIVDENNYDAEWVIWYEIIPEYFLGDIISWIHKNSICEAIITYSRRSSNVILCDFLDNPPSPQIELEVTTPPMKWNEKQDKELLKFMECLL